MSVVSKLHFTYASRSSHSWLSKQSKLVQSSKLVEASLSCAELGTAQPQLVFCLFFVSSQMWYYKAQNKKFLSVKNINPSKYSVITSLSLINFLIHNIYASLSKPRLNYNSTHVGFDMKMHAATTSTTHYHHHPNKLNGSIISAVIEPIMTKPSLTGDNCHGNMQHFSL